MVTLNNFTKNDQGLSIEFSGSYDQSRSQDDFRENFDILQFSDRSTISVLFYNPCDQIVMNLDLKIKALKKDMIEFYNEYVNQYADCDKSWYKSEIEEEIIIFLDDELRNSRFNLNDLQQCYSEMNIEFKSNIVSIGSCGYSQGDYSEILIDLDLINNLWGSKYKTEDDIEDLKKSIHHLLWDCPIYAEVTIDDYNLNYYEFDLDEYKFDKELWIEKILKLYSKDKKWELEEISKLNAGLKGMIPNDLDWH